LNEGKVNNGKNSLTYTTISKLISSYVGTVVGASGYLRNHHVLLYVSNAELALFIPVPIKAKYFVPGLVAVDLYLWVHQSLWRTWNCHFAHVGGALFNC
jgi:hypothetical protein